MSRKEADASGVLNMMNIFMEDDKIIDLLAKSFKGRDRANHKTMATVIFFRLAKKQTLKEVGRKVNLTPPHIRVVEYQTFNYILRKMKIKYRDVIDYTATFRKYIEILQNANVLEMATVKVNNQIKEKSADVRLVNPQ